MPSLWIAYYHGENMPGTPGAEDPPLILRARSSTRLRYGRNNLLLAPESGEVATWFAGSRCGDAPPAVQIPVGMLSSTMRSATRAFAGTMVSAAPDAWHPGLRPFLCGLFIEGEFHLYAIVEETPSEVSALRYADPIPGLDDSRESFIRALCAAEPHLHARLPLLNTGRCYAQWRQDLEMERKYTYRTIPDIWSLAVQLYRELAAGRCVGFFPEPHMGFQVFDYDNNLFEVAAPSTEAGYISFIPQVDGNVIVKRKWFQENAEIRRESLWPNEVIAPHTYLNAARDRVSGEVAPLPPFRRKRFDINYESLETGHIYGVYFDICRTIGSDVDCSFGQVEVEYCRSRTVLPLEDIMPEYERICASTHTFLKQHGVAFEQDLYSKLDFSRAAHALIAGG